MCRQRSRQQGTQRSQHLTLWRRAVRYQYVTMSAWSISQLLRVLVGEHGSSRTSTVRYSVQTHFGGRVSAPDGHRAAPCDPCATTRCPMRRTETAWPEGQSAQPRNHTARLPPTVLPATIRFATCFLQLPKQSKLTCCPQLRYIPYTNKQATVPRATHPTWRKRQGY